MKLKDLATHINISLESLQNFIHDFGIDIYQAVSKNLEVTEEFKSFVLTHQEFLRNYNEDYGKEKTVADIAQTLKVKEETIINFFKENGLTSIDINTFTTTVSSYVIHIYIGGNYDFISKAFPCYSKITDKALIGYSDLFFYITDMLDPFINKEQLSQWGILRPAGIVLYGPPGSGKIFWAKKIADIIGYQFVHLYKDYLNVQNGSSSAKSQFNKFIMEKLKEPKSLLFIEDFDELMRKDKNKTYAPETIDLINAIARHIQKNVHTDVVFIGSAEVLSFINDEIVAPGRFDLHIPIFPPSENERADLLLYHMMANLADNSPLINILKKNKALERSFWEAAAAQMKLFSNTMLIDFTQSLKKRLYAIYRKNENRELLISNQLLAASYNEARSKLTQDYIRHCAAFILEAKQNVGTDFPHRILEMEAELDFYKVKQEPVRKIGFKVNEEDDPQLKLGNENPTSQKEFYT